MSAFPKVENFSHSFVEKARRGNPAQFSTLWKTISDDGGGVFHKKSTKEENLWKTFLRKKFPFPAVCRCWFQKTAGFCRKRTAFLVEYSKNEVYILYNSTKKCVSLFTFCEF